MALLEVRERLTALGARMRIDVGVGRLLERLPTVRVDRARLRKVGFAFARRALRCESHGGRAQHLAAKFERAGTELGPTLSAASPTLDAGIGDCGSRTGDGGSRASESLDGRAVVIRAIGFRARHLIGRHLFASRQLRGVQWRGDRR